MKRFILLLLLLAAVAGGVGFWYYRANAQPHRAYRTAPVERGAIMAAIGATGTIMPEEVIDVGAQVAGRIDRFGPDPSTEAVRQSLLLSSSFPVQGLPVGLALLKFVPARTIDYTSPVNEGTVLAQLDPSLYQARVDTAVANLLKARADLVQMQAKQHQTEREWERSQGLAARKAIATSDFDIARSDYEAATANIQVGRAAIAQTQAALDEARTNLGYTTISSPVKGVIIDRRVNVGQTVVASLNAPSLFLIAKDLKRLQVWASVNEADIGQIHQGQPVYFTVDAHPGERFTGYVSQLRLNASMTQNVVTYTIVVATDNSDAKLKPYLTANLQFVIGQRETTLIVPSAALRWNPQQPDEIAPDAREAYPKSKHAKRSGGAAKSPAQGEGAHQKRGRGTVWVVDGEYVRPIRVRVGLTDGTASTEVIADELTENMEVVVGEARRDNGGDSANPFTPTLFGKKKKD